MTNRPCQVASHTFADGTTLSSCLGIRDGRRCTYATGQANKALNNKKHSFVTDIVDLEEEEEPDFEFMAVDEFRVEDIRAGEQTVIAVADDGTETTVLAADVDPENMDEEQRVEAAVEAAAEPDLKDGHASE